MVVKADDRVARPYNFAIIDEVDSVLIDEEYEAQPFLEAEQ